VEKIKEGLKLKPGFELAELDVSDSSVVPWDFAPRIVQQQKDEQSEGKK